MHPVFGGNMNEKPAARAFWLKKQFDVQQGTNKVTAEQLKKLIRCARQLTNNCILLVPNYHEEGESGFKVLLWKLCEAKVTTSLGWSSKTNAGRQPKSLTQQDWQLLASNPSN